MTPRCFKCSQFRKGTLDFTAQCNKLLQNYFCKQGYTTLNATIPGQDRINPKTHLCRTFFAEYIILGPCVPVMDAKPLFSGFCFIGTSLYATGVDIFVMLCFNCLCTLMYYFIV